MVAFTTPGTDHIKLAWASLGIAYYVDESLEAVSCADPEQTFLASIPQWSEDRKLLKLMLSWAEVYGDLLHIERLHRLAAELPAVDLAWLGGFAEHRLKKKDLRWGMIVKFCKERLGKQAIRVETSRLDELQAKRNGSDEAFSKFGILIPKTEPADRKKITPREVTIKGHGWLRMRLIFGTNFRADIAYALTRPIPLSGVREAEKMIGCSHETAYRLWHNFQEGRMRDLLKLA